MKYTPEERLDIGRQIYDGELSRYEAAEQYPVWEAETYAITYDANGGTGAPETQTKTYNLNLKLSSTTPTRTDASAGNYTVTLNWNTEKDGSGAAYNAGGKYSTNESVILYVQWKESTTTATVVLPTPTREGYTFKGWGTSASATSGVTGSYTPGSDVTLYAVWEQNAAPPQDLFTDVINPDAYYYDAVYWARDNGITTGKTPTTFQPDGACTRGQIVTFLYRYIH